MFRQALLSLATLGILTTAAMPASAQPVWGSVSTGFRIGHVPVGLTVGTAPAVPVAAPVYPAPVYPAPVYAQPVVYTGAPYYYNGQYYPVPRYYPDRHWVAGRGWVHNEPVRGHR